MSLNQYHTVTEFILGETKMVPVRCPYLDKAHIKVYVDNIETTDFQWVNDNWIRLGPGVPSGTVRIQRVTPLVEWSPALVAGELIESDKINIRLQTVLYWMQESLDSLRRTESVYILDVPATTEDTVVTSRIARRVSAGPVDVVVNGVALGTYDVGKLSDPLSVDLPVIIGVNEIVATPVWVNPSNSSRLMLPKSVEVIGEAPEVLWGVSWTNPFNEWEVLSPLASSYDRIAYARSSYTFTATPNTSYVNFSGGVVSIPLGAERLQSKTITFVIDIEQYAVVAEPRGINIWMRHDPLPDGTVWSTPSSTNITLNGIASNVNMLGNYVDLPNDLFPLNTPVRVEIVRTLDATLATGGSSLDFDIRMINLINGESSYGSVPHFRYRFISYSVS